MILRVIRRTGIRIGAIDRVILAGDGIAQPLAGDVLDQQPGREQQRKIDNGKEQHQEDGRRQGELDHALRAAGPLPKAFSIFCKAKPRSFHIHRSYWDRRVAILPPINWKILSRSAPVAA